MSVLPSSARPLLGGPTTIRVVDARRAQTDFRALTSTELAAALSPLVAAEEPGPARQSLLAFERLAARLHELQAHRPDGGLEGEEMEEVALRQLLFSPEVVPVVRWPPGRQDPDGGLRVRPGRRAPALSESGAEVALASEEAVVVTGLALAPKRQGGLVLEAYGCPPHAPPETAGPAPVLSVALGRRAPASSPLAPPPGPPAPPGGHYDYSPSLVKALRRQLGWAAHYHLSGAGGELASRAAELASEAAGAAARPPADGRRRAAAPAREGVGWGGELVLERGRHFLAALARAGSGAPGEEAAAGSTPWAGAVLADILREGGWPPFCATLVEGRESPSAEAFLAAEAHARACRRARAALLREDEAATAQVRQLLLVVEDRLGPLRAAELAAAAPGSPEALLAALAPEERALAKQEHERRREAWAAEAGNRCPHVGLARRMRRAVSAREALQLLGELEAFLAPPPAGGAPPGWRLCAQCGYRALCPHVAELVRMRAQGLPYDTVRARLHKYAVRLSGRGPAQAEYAYFCRTCGELLATFVQEGRQAEALGAVGGLEPGLRRLLWAEGLELAPSIQLPVAAADPRTFAAAAADATHPLLLAAEAVAARRGRPPPPPDDPYGAAEEAAPPRTRLAAALFVHGYLLHLIQSTAGSPATAVGFAGVPPGAKLPAYARALLEALARRHRALLAQLEDVTERYLVERLREAYRLVAGGGVAVVTVADEAARLVLELTQQDPVYAYAVAAAQAFGAAPPGPAVSPEAVRAEFGRALGPWLPERLFAKKGASRGAPALPLLAQKLLGLRPGRSARRLTVEVPAGVELQDLYGDPVVNLYAKVWAPPPGPDSGEAALAACGAFAAEFPACGAAAAREAIVGGRAAAAAKRAKRAKPPAAAPKAPAPKAAPAAAAPVSAAFPRSPWGAELSAAASAAYRQGYRLFAAYTSDAYTPEKRQAFASALAEGLSREKGLALRKLVAAAPSFRALAAYSRLRRYGHVGGGGVGIAFLFDEEGLPHSWTNAARRLPQPPPSKYVYDGDGRLELTRAEVVTALAAARQEGAPSPLWGKKLVDLRCTVCGALMSEVGRLDAAKVRASLAANQDFAAFFAFYQARCPEGDVHAFTGGACSRCGLPQALVYGYREPARQAAARAFYERYRSRFREERGAAVRVAPLLEAARHHHAPAAPPPELRAFAESWRPDFEEVRRGAAAAEVPVAALEALGATERRAYADVLSGVGAPPPPTRTDDGRLAAADGAVRLFVSAYNRARYVSRFPVFPPELVGLFAEVALPPHEHPALPRLLPDVLGGYRKKRAALLRYRPPADVLAFTIQELGRMAAEAAATGPEPPWLPLLARGLVRQAMGEVVQCERLLAKPGAFNFKIFGDDPDADIDPLGTADPVDTPGEVGGDVLPGEVAAADPFSLAGVDIAPEDLGNLAAQ